MALYLWAHDNQISAGVLVAIATHGSPRILSTACPEPCAPATLIDAAAAASAVEEDDDDADDDVGAFNACCWPDDRAAALGATVGALAFSAATCKMGSVHMGDGVGGVGC